MLKKARALYRVRIYKIKRLRWLPPSFFLSRDVRHSGMRSSRLNRGETSGGSFAGSQAFAFYALVSLHKRKRCTARTRGDIDRYDRQDRATNGLIFFVEAFHAFLQNPPTPFFFFFRACFAFTREFFSDENEILIKDVAREWPLFNSSFSSRLQISY